jgi:hypothetical protein
MSKLIEKLERISEGRAQPRGCSAAINRAKAAPMLLVAGIPSEAADMVSSALDEGVDALVFITEEFTADQPPDEASQTVWGTMPKKVSTDDIQKLVDKACDFVLFTPGNTPASLLKEDKFGKILRVDPSLDDNLARTISRIPVNGIALDFSFAEGYPLTVHQVMVYERLASLAGKHLLAFVPPEFPIDDLENLFSLGVRGLIVDLRTAAPVKRLAEAREAIQKLPLTRRKSGEKYSAVLPRYAEAPDTDEDEEEDI